MRPRPRHSYCLTSPFTHVVEQSPGCQIIADDAIAGNSSNATDATSGSLGDTQAALCYGTTLLCSYSNAEDCLDSRQPNMTLTTDDGGIYVTVLPNAPGPLYDDYIPLSTQWVPMSNATVRLAPTVPLAQTMRQRNGPLRNRVRTYRHTRPDSAAPHVYIHERVESERANAPEGPALYSIGHR